MPEIERKWNEAIDEREGDFLQSWEWGEFQKRRGGKIERIESDGAKVLLIRQRLPCGKIAFYAPRGPAVGSRTEFGEIFTKMIEIGRQNKAAFLKIEPVAEKGVLNENDLRSVGLIRVERRQPEETRVIDLKKREEELLKEMEAETRYAIRTAEKRGVTVERFSRPEIDEEKFSRFWNLFVKTFRRHELVSHPRDYYRDLLDLGGETKTELFFAKQEDRIIAAAMILVFRKTAIYLHAASAEGFGRYNAPTYLLWQMIRWAKKEGSDCFDLWGISHSEKKWQGITEFKKRLGGREVRHLGAWDYVLRPGWYRLFRILRFFAKIAR
jgi:lipid II:glycine glycyltransferase (peptidoglycan interpeptide bridge formation enzyme)